MKEKIKEAARKHEISELEKNGYRGFHGGDIVTGSFVTGANFALEEAFRWHDPAKEEPISNPLILKIEDGGYCEYRVGWHLEHKYRGWGFYTYPEPDVEFLVTGVVGYRPINLEDL